LAIASLHFYPSRMSLSMIKQYVIGAYV